MTAPPVLRVPTPPHALWRAHRNHCTIDPEKDAYGQAIRAHHEGEESFDSLLAAPEEMRDLVGATPWELREVVEGEGDRGAYVGVLEKR